MIENCVNQSAMWTATDSTIFLGFMLVAILFLISIPLWSR